MTARQAQARIVGLFVIALLVGGMLGAIFAAPSLAYTHTVERLVTKTLTTGITETALIERTVTESKALTVSIIIPTTTTETVTTGGEHTITHTINHTLTVISNSTITVNQTVTVAETTKTSTTTVTETIERVREQVLQVCFSRTQDCAPIIASWILKANKSIHIMVYSFTSQVIASALIVARTQNPSLDIRVVIEESQVNVTGSVYQMLVDANITVAIDGNPYLMHHKVAIIDGRIVITGSYNYSQSAEDRNDENLVVIVDEEIAQLYEQEFQRVWSKATA